MVFSEQAKAAGVTVNVNKIDSSQFFGTTGSPTPSQRISGRHGSSTPPGFPRLPNAPWNETHWKDAEWLKIVEEAHTTWTTPSETNSSSEALKIDYDQGGYIIWSFPELLDGHSDKVAGGVPDVLYLSAIRWRFNELYFV